MTLFSHRKRPTTLSASPASPKAGRPAVELLEERQLLTAWYVSTGGSNANPGTLARPFQTIQRAATLAQPGDTVFIFGGTYHETVIPAHSGTASAPITYRPYNSAPVTIDGADSVSGWTLYQGHIYTAKMPWDLGEGNNQVFVDGAMTNEARFPNTSLDPSTPTWATASSVNVTIANSGLSSVTIHNASLTQPAGAWVGAVGHISPGQQWLDQVGTVTASGPGWITMQYAQDGAWEVPQKGNPFYIVGAFKGLDAAGEWYRDPITNQLFLWTPNGDSPASHGIAAKARLYGFDLSNDAYITVTGINLFACTINTNANSNHLLLDHLGASYVSHTIGVTPDNLLSWNAASHPHTTGIIINGYNNVVQNSTINFSSGDGIFLGGSYNTAQNNIITNTDYEAGDEAAISVVGGTKENVVHNTISIAGRSGIVYRNSTASYIAYNDVYHVALQMTDCGGIYTYGDNSVGTVISHNIFNDIHSGGFLAGGIYLDNGSQNFIVDHNLVFDCDIALKLNIPTFNCLIVNNTLLGTSYSMTDSGNLIQTGTVFVNNIFNKSVQFGPGALVLNELYGNVNPRFTDAAHNKYTLASNSPAIDAGRVYAPYTNGYMGKAPDLGCYEYGMSPWLAGAMIQPVNFAAVHTLRLNQWGRLA